MVAANQKTGDGACQYLFLVKSRLPDCGSVSLREGVGEANANIGCK